MYAKLLVRRGSNVQPGQDVQIDYEPYAEELAHLALEEAYACGARHVHLTYTHPRAKYAQLTKGPESERFYFPPYEKARYDSIVDSGGCYLNLRSDSEPDLFKEISTLSAQYKTAMYKSMKARFTAEGINKGRVAWCIAYVSTPKSAVKIYPDLSLEDAHRAYWDAIFRMTYCDTEDCLERWEDIDRLLHARRAKLDARALSKLHFKGPGTDLTVGLSPRARWMGGSKKTVDGKSFTANVPSFEVFTTPDWRQTEGKVRITRPILLVDTLVEGLELEFEKGVVVQARASTGIDTYRSHIATDPGASRLGEVALVGGDSPVLRESKLLREILYTENGACHIATGMGYVTCLKDGFLATKEELEALGRNDSVTHLDVMISDKEVDVWGFGQHGTEAQLLSKGDWVPEFA